MHDLLTPGKIGESRLEAFEVSELASRMTAISHRPGLNYVPPGKYLRLYVGGVLMMSDTPMEVRTNWDVMNESWGNVLIAGLGMGAILPTILADDRVLSATVIERSADVVRLVGPQLATVAGGDKLRIVNADIFEWRPRKGVKFDTIYFDIWPNICIDNLDEIRVLHQRFKGYKSKAGTMSSWMADYLRAERRADNRRSRYW
jgi:hypothetical protein